MINGRPTQAIINLAALRHNVTRIKYYAPASKIFAIIKANGYGHGSVTVAQAIADKVHGFGVACLTEALTLRQAGINQRILILEGFFKPQELSLIAEQELDIAVHNFEQIAALNSFRFAKPISVWLKVDTGMHRLGFPLEQVEEAARALNRNPNIRKPINWMTHFSDADDLNSPKTTIQLQRFQYFFQQGGTGLKTLANSAGIVAWPASHADYVRPGIMLYGVSPLLHKTAAEFELKPVMTLCTELIAINKIKAGEAIGYGGTWTAPEDMRVGIAAIGYGDGYPVHAKSGTPVLLNGQRTQLIGRVSMDMLAIDLRTQPQAKIGDPVILWGDGLPIEEIAVWADTIPYELFCRVSRRVEFRIKA
ncbi:MAG: alr [Gammaproteobacteria bacterium]|jgi:alanine racemase|nr:alr [Gammaproteobacteria bacterium]